jgi:tetratricopeptide (TPR) repeat protein
VAPDVAVILAPRVVTPAPGSIDAVELDGASETQLALLSAIVAAGHLQECHAALAPLLARVSSTQTSLSDYDNGRFWHLRGVTALHLEQDLSSATHALNRSLAFLSSDQPPQMRAYRARVYDTSGQLSQRQGHLREARREFELALQHRELNDVEGTALTLGHLGRLCMDLGDFASAAEYLGRHLNIVTQRTPERTEVRAQLLAHLGTCALGRGGLTAARNYFQASKRLAQADGNAYGLACAALGLGQRAVRCGKMATVQRQIQEVQRQLASAQFPTTAADRVRGGLSQLVAEMHLVQQRPTEAMTAFIEARQLLARATDVSPVAMATLLYGLAQAHLQRDEGAPAAICLRAALQSLAATTAERLRQEIEDTLATRAIPLAVET